MLHKFAKYRKNLFITYAKVFVMSFLGGAAGEFAMINVTIGKTNFYNVFIEKEVKRTAEQRIRLENQGIIR